MDRPNLIVYVHGFGGEQGMAYNSFEKAVYNAARSWIPFYVHRWRSGHLHQVLADEGITVVRDLLGGKGVGKATCSLIERALDKLDNLESAAKEGAERLRAYLQDLCARRKRFSIIAYSTGTKVTRNAISEGHGPDPISHLHRVVLVGSILTDSELVGLPDRVKGQRVTVTYPPEGKDDVLRNYYPWTSFATGGPIPGKVHTIGEVGSFHPEVENILVNINNHLDYRRFGPDILRLALRPLSATSL